MGRDRNLTRIRKAIHLSFHKPPLLAHEMSFLILNVWNISPVTVTAILWMFFPTKHFCTVVERLGWRRILYVSNYSHYNCTVNCAKNCQETIIHSCTIYIQTGKHEADLHSVMHACNHIKTHVYTHTHIDWWILASTVEPLWIDHSW